MAAMSLKEIFEAIINYQIPFDVIGMAILGLICILLLILLIMIVVNWLREIVDLFGTGIAQIYQSVESGLHSLSRWLNAKLKKFERENSA